MISIDWNYFELTLNTIGDSNSLSISTKLYGEKKTRYFEINPNVESTLTINV